MKQVINGGWRQARLGEVLTLQRGYDLPQRQRIPGSVPLVSSPGITDYHAVSKVKGPGVVTGRYGTLGEVFFVPDDFWPLNTTLYVSDFKGNDPRFISYFLRAIDFLAYSDKAAVPGVNRNHLHEAEVLYPTAISEQRAIAHILGTLDDKIELNRRMNQTLEEMARAIFQDWFVDFGPVHAKLEGREPYLPPDLWDLFPDRLVDSELGEIPEGWEVRRIEDISERVAMGPFGSSIKVSTFVDSGIPVISGQHLTGTLLEDGDYRFITEDHADKLANANVRRGDLVFTHAGSIGQVAYIPETSQYDRYVISQRQFYMRCDTSKISPLFVVHFFKMQEGQHQLLANTSSTGVPSLARPVTYLRSVALCVPPKALWSIFHKMAGGFYRTVARNDNEGRTIVAQRDALLPKLVSGEVRIRNV